MHAGAEKDVADHDRARDRGEREQRGRGATERGGGRFRLSLQLQQPAGAERIVVLLASQIVFADGEQPRVGRLQQSTACESGSCRQQLEHCAGS